MNGAGSSELQRLVDEQRAAQAAEARMRERWLLQQAGEEAALGSLLAELVASRCPVVLRTLAGRTHHGVITGAGRDCCTIATPAAEVHVPVTAVAAVRPAPGAAAPDAVGVDAATGGGTFAAVLERLAEQRPRVQVATLAGGGLFAGTLVAVGRDLLTLVLDGEHQPCYLRLDSVSEVCVLLSG